jgi:hypothetical protein
MPWSPTKFLSHPLANVNRPTGVDPKTANYFSFLLVETITWQGLGDLINNFRENTLGLNAMNSAWAPNVLQRLKIPFTYCFSPSLIPKPLDWKSHISVTGFNFLPPPQDYTPPPDLCNFLAAGEKPVYMGFGSIVVDDPNALTDLIFSAVQASGVRALVSKGWGGLGAAISVPENIFLLGNVPHSWLFNHVSAVVHHGGAGTCAIGIARGKPTVIVPFFGDQPFWGDMIERAKAGPKPIPFKKLTAEKLADAIRFALRQESSEAARELARKVERENGPEEAARAFNTYLPLESMECELCPGHVAVWRLKRMKRTVRLSAVAMAILVRENILTYQDVKLYVLSYRTIPYLVLLDCKKLTIGNSHRITTYPQDPGPLEPISGSITASISALSDLTIGLGNLGASLSRKISDKSSSSVDLTTGTKLSPSDASSDRASRDILRRPVTPERSASASSLRKGLKRLGSGTKASIVDIPMAITQGMHNAPRLYGDNTVREAPKISGFGSGMSAAGKVRLFPWPN